METLISERKQQPKYKPKTNHTGHTGYLNTVMLSPDGSLCAFADKDDQAMLWDLNEAKHHDTLDGGDIISALCLIPNCYWLCAATGPHFQDLGLEVVCVWGITIGELKQEVTSTSNKAEPPQCTSLVCCADGQTPWVTQTTWCECGT